MCNMLYSVLIICECVLFAISASPVVDSDNYCQSKTQNTHLHLATKTPYRFIVNKDDSPPTYEGCSPEKIWLVVRHGTRNPSHKVIRKMRERLPILQNAIMKNAAKNRTSLCDEEIALLSTWSTELEEADEKRLTHEGEDEMIELAERFQNRFNDLLSENYTNSTMKFRHTATQRTAESARYFTVGLFGRRVSRYVWFPEALYRDPILRFYKLCSRWRSEVKKNPEAWKDKQLFESSPEMMRTLQDISSRLGLGNVSVDDAELMYVTCAFETAWHWKTPSPWCAAFSEEDLETMEYHADLEYYWIDGYGHNLTYKQACPVIGDVFNFLECEDGPRVLTLHQERPVALPGCPPHHDLCPLETLRDQLHHSLSACDFDAMCGRDR
ncbi:Multiple inositol polyphosphate phosphatase 1 [Gryllus bimaculatus]|nr:Multiple inositol polyphosphate phosphatase 1 [Gryllus bimaculatus]